MGNDVPQPAAYNIQQQLILYGNDLNKKNPIYDGEHKKVYQVENEAGN